uniref:Phospholipid-transporting ATPase n=1 Tax=Compsopogon caeruleus TaxID=31354 RepID=A0A7S1TCF0_9RHOD
MMMKMEDHMVEFSQRTRQYVEHSWWMMVRKWTWWRRRSGELEPIRTVHVNDPVKNNDGHFADNFVSTAKFNLWNAVPKFLMEQFSRTANVYFLLVGVLSCIDAITPVQTAAKFGGLISLAVVLAVSGVKETIEDLRRHREDNRVNGLKTLVLGKGESRWAALRVGDIVEVRDKEYFPADLLLIQCSSEDGVAYVETKGLDGESNLKVKVCIPELVEAVPDADHAENVKGHIECEGANDKIYRFVGSVALSYKDSKGLPCSTKVPVGPEQLLVRGSSLQNTEWVLGIVVYAGRDTKLMKNMKPRPRKESHLEKKLNVFFIIPLLVQIALVVGATIMYARSCHGLQTQWYIFPDGVDNNPCTAREIFFRMMNFFILYSGMIPISLYISLEIVRTFQVYFIEHDQEMFDRERRIACEVRTSNVNEEPGMATHIFCDKTGTLTSNKMVFQKCSIGKKVYACEPTRQEIKLSQLSFAMKRYVYPNESSLSFPRIDSDDVVSREDCMMALEIFRTLVLCNTVIPETQEKGSKVFVNYQSTSPDEIALVNFARSEGFEFHTRTNKHVTLRNPNGLLETWELLGVLEFSSTRKRMSVIVRSPEEGRIFLYCKGADSVMFDLCADGQEQLIEEVRTTLDNFAAMGLRTLCIAYRELTEDLFHEWILVYTGARGQLQGRDQAMENAFALVEQNLTLIGATAIEDKLQEEVPETLVDLERAGIKIWILTGDKQETAINIGLSCGLLDDEMDVVLLNETNIDDTQAQIDCTIGRWTALMHDGHDGKHFGLVVDGGTLVFALHPLLERKFALLSDVAKVVIACRVTPRQKTELVELVRRNDKRSVTLAIGDGANDVGMIQAAHVGVGIVGLEGVEAKLASDIAIAQFRFLRRIVLVHGRWCYKRLSKMVFYILYKNVLSTFLEFFVSFATNWTGQFAFDPMLLGVYNLFVTPVPPVLLAVMEQDIPAKYALMFPEIFFKSQRRTAFSTGNYLSWLWTGIWHALAIYFFTRLSNGDGPTPNGQAVGFFGFSISIFTTLVIVNHVYLAVNTSNWDWFYASVFVFSMISWLWVAFIFCSAAISENIAPYLTYVAQNVFNQSNMWLILTMTVAVTCLPGFFLRAWRKNFRPDLKQLVVELSRRRLSRSDLFLNQKSLIHKRASMPTFHRRQHDFRHSGFNFDLDDAAAVLRTEFKPDYRKIRMRYLKRSGSDTELDVVGVISSDSRRSTNSHRRAKSSGDPLMVRASLTDPPTIRESGSHPVDTHPSHSTLNIPDHWNHGAFLEHNAQRRRRPRNPYHNYVHFDPDPGIDEKCGDEADDECR